MANLPPLPATYNPDGTLNDAFSAAELHKMDERSDLALAGGHDHSYRIAEGEAPSADVEQLVCTICGSGTLVQVGDIVKNKDGTVTRK